MTGPQKAMLIPRKVAAQSRFVASELAKLQRAHFDAEILEELRQEGTAEAYLEGFDLLDAEVSEDQVYHRIWNVNCDNIEIFPLLLAMQMKSLLCEMGVTGFFVLGDRKCDHFGNRENDFPPLVKAYRQLETIVGGSSYSEAFACPLEALFTWVEILFWRGRCDASLGGYSYLFDQEGRLQIHICKYGNIHIAQFQKEHLSIEKFASQGWTLIEGQEQDAFSTNGRIEGRRLKL